MIVTKELTKVYHLGGTKVHGANKLDLKIESGEFVSVMGPSGSGKSTLLYLMGGLDRPTSGKIWIDGVDIENLCYAKLCDLRKDKIGFIFQSFNLIPTLNALENIFVPLAPGGIRNGQRAYAKKLLEMVDLGDRMGHTPNQLSGGQQQRVAIARAFINKPKIILADEPTGNLDSKSGKEVLQLMRDMNEEKGVTIVVVTHDPNIGKKADRTIHLEDGIIVKEVSNKKFISQHTSPISHKN